MKKKYLLAAALMGLGASIWAEEKTPMTVIFILCDDMG